MINLTDKKNIGYAFRHRGRFDSASRAKCTAGYGFAEVLKCNLYFFRWVAWRGAHIVSSNSPKGHKIGRYGTYSSSSGAVSKETPV